MLDDPWDTAPPTGSTPPELTEVEPEEEPAVPGTLFLSMLLMMGIVGAWLVMYWTLLRR